MIRTLSATLGAAGWWLACSMSAVAATSPECQQALDALQQHEAAQPAKGQNVLRGVPPQLRDLRARTAQICLGSGGAAAAPQIAPQRGARAPSEPIRVAPITAPPAPRPRAAPESAAPLPSSKSPATALSCDVGGCWSNDGRRMQRVGPNLGGPGGQCMLDGNVVPCP